MSDQFASYNKITGTVEKYRGADVISLDFSMTLSTVSYSTFVFQLKSTARKHRQLLD